MFECTEPSAQLSNLHLGKRAEDVGYRGKR